MLKNTLHKLKTCLVQFWYQYIYNWFEWQDAKCWAKEVYPGWLHCFKKCRHQETRDYYKAKILAAYRGEEDGK
jgi:hypothetical protein